MPNQPIKQGFKVAAAVVQYEQTIKKSRFICFLAPASDVKAAQSYIQAIRERYADARHVCWAFVAGEIGNTTDLGCSDDGEPAGTAGKPMLNVLLHSEIGEIVAVVVRYFGGIKLGTGGLVRAYSSSVSEAMKLMTSEEKTPQLRLRLQLPYPLEDAVRRHLAACAGEVLEAKYEDHLYLMCACPLKQLPVFEQLLGEIGRGQIQLKVD